jgi:hypothetical protein
MGKKMMKILIMEVLNCLKNYLQTKFNFYNFLLNHNNIVALLMTEEILNGYLKSTNNTANS